MTTPTTGRAAALTSPALSPTLAAGSYGMRCPGGSSYVPYNRLTGADTRKLAQAIDALAEPLSQVSAKLAGS
jgi:hypothetical protein